MRRLVGVAVVVIAAVTGAAEAGEPDFDEWNAKDIMRTCAPCHGEFGQGGGGGVYPRLAGFHPDYLAEQIRLFKTRERENIPMIPYATDRELPETDIKDITNYLATIKLETRLPELDGDIDGLTRLMQAKQILQIPRWDGDIEKGRVFYKDWCSSCHGREAQGRGSKPPLAGQHSEYLLSTMKAIQQDKRAHPDNEYIDPMTARDIDDLLAYLSILDD